MTMLFDFFGDLLTEKQRDYFDLYHNEDLSLSEIATTAGISRQGVYDIITRAEKTLLELENKTGVVRRWMQLRDELEKIEKLAGNLLQQQKKDGQSTELGMALVSTLTNLIESYHDTTEEDCEPSMQ